MLIVTSLVPILASSDGGRGVPAIDDRPDGWWMGYHRDENANGIDDLLDRAYLGEGGPFELVLAALDHIPTDDDVEWLEDRGFTVIYAAHNFETIVLGDVAGSDLDELVGLDGLVLLEVPPELEYMLNVAVPSMKIRDSTEYSPFTAWELGFKGDGINIAIMDSGVNDQIPLGHSMVDDMDDNPTTYDPKHIAGVEGVTGIIVGGAAVNPEASDSAHGTHVAGDAMGTGTDHQGPAPESRLIDIRVGSLTNLNLAAVLGAIDWCIDNNETDWENDGPANNGVPVLSMSFGGAASNGNDQTSQAVNDAVEAGIVCVIAAGNNGPNNNGLSMPGSADRSINVASYDDHNSVDRGDDTISGFSARGPRADDGDSDVYDEMKPHIAAVGTGVTSALAWSGYLLVSMDGTSMATPEVSGLIALMLEANPSLRPGAPRYELDIKQILADTAQDRAGADRPQYSEKWDRAWGYGQIDGYGAVKRAVDLTMTDADGPDEVDTGTKDVPFEVTLPVTRTPYSIEDDENTFRISIPNDWGRPGAIRISSEGGVAFTKSNTNPVDSGGYWTFEATLTHTEDIDHYQECTVKVEFDSDAPTVNLPTDYDIETKAWTNGVKASNALHTIRVVPVPNIVYNAHSVDDDSLGSSNGNGDGIVNPGEVIELNLQARNIGSQTATNLQGTLSTTSPYVNITDDAESYGNVGQGQNAWSLGDYDFRLSSSAPVGENLTFRLDFEDQPGHTWTDEFDIEVGGTEHDIAVTDVSAPVRAEVGEDVTVTVTLENLGLKDETDVEVKLILDGLTENSTTVDIDSGDTEQVELVWSSDEAGEFELTVRSEPVTGEDAEDNNEMNFTITIYTDKGRVLIDDVNGDPSKHGDLIALLADDGYRIANGSEYGMDLAEMLRSRLVLVPGPGSLSPAYIRELQDYVRLGGGVLLLADDDPGSYGLLTGPMGLNWSTAPGTFNDTTTEVEDHAVTDGISSLFMQSPGASLVPEDAALLVHSSNGANVSAALEYGEGRMVVVSDDDFLVDGDLEEEDNALFPANAAAWLGRTVKTDDLGVARLSVPEIVRPNETFDVDITLINLGTGDASDVDVRIDHAGSSTVLNVTSLPSRGWENLTFEISIDGEGGYRIVGSTPSGDDTPGNDATWTTMDVFNGSGTIGIHTFHGNMSDHGDFLGYLGGLGFEFVEIDTELRYEDAADLDELILLDPANMEDEEITAIHDLVRAGKGLLIVSDGPESANLLADDLGIIWSDWPGREGSTTNIEESEATEGVDALYLRRPHAQLSGPALFYDYPEEGERTLQGSLTSFGEGMVFGTSDIGLFADDNLDEDDNRRFGRQLVRSLIRDPVDHDGAVVNLTYTQYVERNETALFGAMVHNMGTGNDTFNVTLLIEDEEENSTQVALLPGEYDRVVLGFVPMMNGSYNLSIVVEPVDGEDALDNNRLNGTFSVLKVLLHDDCESDTGWDAESIWDISDARWRSGGHSWRYGSDATGNYSTGSGNASLSRDFSLISIKQGVLTFRYYLDMEGDRAEVNVTTDGGETWETLMTLAGLEGRWDTASIPLKDLEGFNVTLVFHVTHDGVDDDGEGLFIDDITVAGFVNVSRVTEILVPEEGEAVSGEEEVLVHARDSDGIVNITWRVDDGDWYEMELKEGSEGDGVWNATLDTTVLSDGNYTIFVRSTNSTDNVTEVNVTVTVDNTPPDVNITHPMEDQHVGDMTPIDFTAEDETSGVERMEIRIAGGSWKASDGHEDWDTRGVADGDHVIQVRVYDAAGNRADAYRNVTVDNTPPDAEFASPVEDEEVNGTITISVDVTDVTGVDSIEYSVGGDRTVMNLTSGNTTDGTWEADWNTSEVEDGDVPIELTCVDALGNTGMVDIEVYVNNVDSPPAVEIVSPEIGDLVSGTVRIYANATDDEGVSSVEYRIDDDASWSEMVEDDEYWAADWSSSSVEDGPHDIHVRVHDSQDQTDSVMINVTVDNTAPEIVIVGPNGFVKEVIKIRADIIDEHLDEAWFRVDNGDWGNMETGDPWYAYIDTLDYNDGDHTIRVRAADEAGNTNQTSWDLEFDNTWPAVDMIGPEQDDTVSGTMTVRAGIDETNIDTVDLKVDGVWSEMTLDGSEYTYDWDSTETADGEVTLEVRCRDAAGNEGYGSVDVSVDNVNDLPVITVIEPDDDLYGKGIDVRVRVEDDRGIDSVMFRPGEEDWTEMESGSGDVYTYSWNTTGLNGDIDFAVKAEDSDGETRQKYGSVDIDTTAPVLEDVEPVSGTVFEDDIRITLTVNEGHLARVQIRIASGSWKTMKENNGEFYHDWNPRDDGSYLVEIRANDTVNNEVTGSFTYTKDSTYPVLDVEMDLSVVQTGYIKLKVDVIDITLEYVEYSIDGSGWEDMTFKAYDRWIIMWNSGSVPDGKHTVSFRAGDAIGHITEKSGETETNNVNDLPQIWIDDPLDGVFAEDVFVQVTVKDDFGIDHVEASIDEGDWTDLWKSQGGSKNSIWRGEVDTTKAEDGMVRLEFRVTDINGSQNSTHANIEVDNTAPDIRVKNPTEGSSVSGNITVRVRTIDPNIKDVSVNFASSFEAMDQEGDIWRIAWDTRPLKEGTHTIDVRAKDTLGNVAFKTWTVEIDNINEDPDVKVLTPSSGTVAGYIEVTARVTDDRTIDTVELLLGDITEEMDFEGDDIYSVSFDTTDLEDAEYTLRVRATDVEGATGSDVKFILIDNVEDPVYAPTISVDGKVSDRSRGTMTFTIRVGNMGNTESTISLSAVHDPGIDVVFDDVEVTLDPGDDESVTVTVYPLKPGTYTIRIYADDHGETVDTTLNVVVPKEKSDDEDFAAMAVPAAVVILALVLVAIYLGYIPIGRKKE